MIYYKNEIKNKGYKYKRKYKQIWINDSIIQTRIPESSQIPEGFVRGKLY
jgi:hypothetical protein